MKNITKILALMSLLVAVALFTGAASAVTVNEGGVKIVISVIKDNSTGNNAGSDVQVHTLTRAQYKEMWNRIAKWQAKEDTTELPAYVIISNMKVGINKVTKSQYLDMYKRWTAYKKAHKGKEPIIIGIEGPAG
jgi:hypothetical protein